MVDRAGRRDHDALRGVALVVEGLQLLARNGADDLGGPDHRAPQRVRAEHRLAEHVEDPLLGIVLVHRDLLEHDLALGLQGFEPRPPDHLGDHVERPLQVTIQHARVQRGRSPGRCPALISAPIASKISSISCER